MMYYSAFGGIAMVVGMVLSMGLLALLIWAPFAIFGVRTSTPQEPPLENLKRRYAKGEISEAEFERAKQHLS